MVLLETWLVLDCARPTSVSRSSGEWGTGVSSSAETVVFACAQQVHHDVRKLRACNLSLRHACYLTCIAGVSPVCVLSCVSGVLLDHRMRGGRAQAKVNVEEQNECFKLWTRFLTVHFNWGSRALHTRLMQYD